MTYKTRIRLLELIALAAAIAMFATVCVPGNYCINHNFHNRIKPVKAEITAWIVPQKK
jgi:hypothetical protein